MVKTKLRTFRSLAVIELWRSNFGDVLVLEMEEDAEEDSRFDGSCLENEMSWWLSPVLSTVTVRDVGVIVTATENTVVRGLWCVF